MPAAGRLNLNLAAQLFNNSFEFAQTLDELRLTLA
jgi:hypothetical protein